MFDGQPQTVEYYTKPDGKQPVTDWLDNLPDVRADARITARIVRLGLGNPGDYKSVDGGVYEMRIDYGPGYRVYFAVSGVSIVLLLCGGTKKTQQADIEIAHNYWADYKQRNKL